jgi:hypothetical protein
MGATSGCSTSRAMRSRRRSPSTMCS